MTEHGEESNAIEINKATENYFVSSQFLAKKKNERKLYKLLAELVETERTYVEDLEVVRGSLS